MPNGQYTSPQPLWQAYASGICLRHMTRKLFTLWGEPPESGALGSDTFDAQVDFQLSTDHGATWTASRAPSTATVHTRKVREFGLERTFETEWAALSIAGGDLPSGVMIRESPTLASKGGTAITAGGGGGGAGGGAAISSFFDVFTEITTDGGQTWAPATNGPAREELARVAPAHDFPTNALPPALSEYYGVRDPFASYPPGIVLTNVLLREFTASFPPPAPGATEPHTFGSTVEMELSMDSGLTFSHRSAPATVTVQFTGRLGGDGTTEYYDTEMLQLNISGGTLPAGMYIRESPTRASPGRTTESATAAGGYGIDSFFDVFTEVSTDGGSTWQPTTIGPGEMALRPPAVAPLTITCPTDMTVRAVNWNGCVVTYPAPTTSGGTPPVVVTSTPPSGALFPVGQTPVICVASDALGQVASDSFKVTVVADPEIYNYPHSVARLTLQGATGGGTVNSVGPSRIESYIGPNGEAEETDGDGLDDVATELSQLKLRGYGPSLGPAKLRLRGGLRTAGRLEDRVNNTPGILDVLPHSAIGQVDSFFDVWAEIEIGGQWLHTAAPFRVGTILGWKSPLVGDTYKSSIPQPIALLDENEQPSGKSLTYAEYVPATTVELDEFTNTEAVVTVAMPAGSSESSTLRGKAGVRVYFEGGEGVAVDHDADGRDDTLAELVLLDLRGTNSQGVVSMGLAADPISLGGIEETANATPGMLDVRPFTAAGSCDSFFDVFFTLDIGGQTLHNAGAWRLQGSITHKPPAAGEMLKSPQDASVVLSDPNGSETKYTLLHQWHVLVPPDLDIQPFAPGAVTISWPIPSEGYQLESCSNVMPPVVWEDVTNEVTTGSDRKSVVRGAVRRGELFRLRRPLP